MKYVEVCLYRVAALFFGIIFSFILIIGLELFCFVALKLKGVDHIRFLYNSGANKTYNPLPSNNDKKTSINTIDPILGYAHSIYDLKLKVDSNKFSVVPGFVIHHSKKRKINNKIITLGGSTTDPTFRNYSWPNNLQELTDDNSLAYSVYNGGVSGYSTSQELLKLIRDVLPLDPEIVISLNGVNDIANLARLDGYPLIHPYQKELFNKFIKKNWSFFPSTFFIAKRLLRKVNFKNNKDRYINYGTLSKMSDFKIWEKNIKLMNTICTQNNIKFFSILQPIMGFSNYKLSKKELEWYERRKKMNLSYFEDVDIFYEKARNICGDYPFCIDLTTIFDEHSNVYADPRHQNNIGVKILADSIYTNIFLNDDYLN